MPESLILSFFRYEITRKLDRIHVYGAGTWRFHSTCCASIDGQRQTVTLHKCRSDDHYFEPFPAPPDIPISASCLNCNQSKKPARLSFSKDKPVNTLKETYYLLAGKPATEVINGLSIHGLPRVLLRGKELVIIINQFLFRIGFGLEGHCFWLSTLAYRSIISQPLVKRGKKSFGYKIPSDYWNGSPAKEGIISIQAALECPDWTLVFCDHNVMISFHAMALRHIPSESALEPGSEIWPLLWSASHGPCIELELVPFLDGLERFRSMILSSKERKPIWNIVKDRQDVFNGFGAQEANDMLANACIFPLIPAFNICNSTELWSRFRTNVVTYQQERVRIGNGGTLPNGNTLPTAGGTPFRFNVAAHTDFLSSVLCYRRARFKATQEFLDSLGLYNLGDKDAVIDDDGYGRDGSVACGLTGAYSLLPTNPTVDIGLKLRPGARYKILKVYAIQYQLNGESGEESVKKHRVYSPIVAQPDSSWPITIRSVTQVEIDVRDDFHLTTLGPYSFHVFVSAVVTSITLKTDEIRKVFLRGRLSKKNPRPLAKRIQYTADRVAKRQGLGKPTVKSGGVAKQRRKTRK